MWGGVVEGIQLLKVSEMGIYHGNCILNKMDHGCRVVTVAEIAPVLLTSRVKSRLVANSASRAPFRQLLSGFVGSWHRLKHSSKFHIYHLNHFTRQFKPSIWINPILLRKLTVSPHKTITRHTSASTASTAQPQSESTALEDYGCKLILLAS